MILFTSASADLVNLGDTVLLHLDEQAATLIKHKLVSLGLLPKPSEDPNIKRVVSNAILLFVCALELT